MPAAAPRSDEARSQQALDDLRVLDTAPEPEFDALVRAASLLCGVPVALISLIDRDRQWFKANVGLPSLTQTPREQALCAHTVLGDDLLEVADASQDPRFADNPLVTGQPDIRFYAGAPLRLRSGHRVGTLCLIDHQPRRLSADQREALQCLALAAASALESRRASQARAQAMADLAASEARFRALSDGSPLGVYQTDAAGNCVYTNQPWQALHGLSQPQSLGSAWADAVHPEDRAAMLAACRRSALARVDFDLAFRVQRPDGSIRHVHARARPILDQQQALLGHIGSVEDVTERRQIDQALAAKRAELTRSNQDLERFAYVASHDLQEPLRMVSSYGQLLMRRHAAELSAEAQEFLHYMVDGGQRAQALIRDLLSLARIDSAAQPHQAVALGAVLAQALQQLRLQVQETGARISHDPLPTVLADPLQIGQLLSNLLGNALKFRSQAPPAVHIGAERLAGAWRISVRDNGIGIDPKYSERVFVMFQRLHLRSEHEGTGIGLAICKKVVENHGGQIGLHSVPGQGSTFHFTLPDAPSPPPGAATTP